MPVCTKCRKTFPDGEVRTHPAGILCDDCYIDAVTPRMPKSHYNDDAEFMNRLKDAYPAHQQRYH